MSDAVEPVNDGVERGTSARSETAVERPFLQVISPDATSEEVAALVTVFAALVAAGSERPTRPTSAWAAPARQVRETFRHGVGGWRASSLPR